MKIWANQTKNYHAHFTIMTLYVNMYGESSSSSSSFYPPSPGRRLAIQFTNTIFDAATLNKLIEGHSSHRRRSFSHEFWSRTYRFLPREFSFDDYPSYYMLKYASFLFFDRFHKYRLCDPWNFKYTSIATIHLERL